MQINKKTIKKTRKRPQQQNTDKSYTKEGHTK